MGPLTVEKKHHLLRLLAIRQLANLTTVHLETQNPRQGSHLFLPVYSFIVRWLLTTLHNRPLGHHDHSTLLIDIASVEPAENHVLIVLAPANARRLQLVGSFATDIYKPKDWLFLNSTFSRFESLTLSGCDNDPKVYAKRFCEYLFIFETLSIEFQFGENGKIHRFHTGLLPVYSSYVETYNGDRDAFTEAG